MAGSLNKVTLIGNLGADPDIKNLNSGVSVANFSLATSESWKDKTTGEKKEVTQWHRVVVWNDGLIGVIDKYVKKGSKVYIEGELQTRKWEKDGVDHYATEVVLTGFGGKLILLGDSGGGARSDQNGNADRPGNKSGSYGEQSGGTARNGDGGGASRQSSQRQLDDEIPF
ncbi:single-strand DNA-binding protein [Mesorhizobium muleiense]|uniref:Single-stranded DNA-binding protein n=1 Tax=Mesorhizobium muleiense TaxID=1004279 RepID=A0A1G9H197_9HYPH|nr:single-stranded DNA-binding protein [Mesorhizobium muleiense]SDL06313.1 single-strand DNA-binding protein [Mesorhizobium muleiense]